MVLERLRLRRTGELVGWWQGAGMKMSPGFLRELEAIAPVKLDEPLGRYTTIGVGGPADAYAVARSARQVADIVGLCRRAEVPFFVLGSGSNIVVGDRGIRGVTIGNSAQALSEPELVGGDGARYVVRADAGCSFAAVSRQLAFAGYAGLEWACGIPGTLGGAVVYNAGAYGGCLGDVLQRVVVAGDDGDLELQAADLGLVYRGSDFTRGLMAGKAVLWAEFTLWPGDAAELRARVARLRRPPPCGPAARPQRRLLLQEPAGPACLEAPRRGGPARPPDRRRPVLGKALQLPGQRRRRHCGRRRRAEGPGAGPRARTLWRRARERGGAGGGGLRRCLSACDSA